MTDKEIPRLHFFFEACIFVYSAQIPRDLFIDTKHVNSTPECSYALNLSVQRATHATNLLCIDSYNYQSLLLYTPLPPPQIPIMSQQIYINTIRRGDLC